MKIPEAGTQVHLKDGAAVTSTGQPIDSDEPGSFMATRAGVVVPVLPSQVESTEDLVFDESHDACADCGRQIRWCEEHGWEHAADHRCFLHGPRCAAEDWEGPIT